MSTLQNSAARAVADVTQGMLLATIDIAAPVERVFRAITSEEVALWWGSPELYRVTKWTGELRVGGAWRSDGVGADGKAFSVHGEFCEIEPPTKLVQTWKPDWDTTNRVTTITWRLTTIEGGTRVVIRHEGFGDAHELCASHANGWERVLSWLSAHWGKSS
ncbi:MAG TPA: SRPBCC domain-containing protein [Polyangiaceae bacterium]|nr:SRPBCC domain-containing protein [Polyangiaceae bacterium]